ncbi:hypothetical protein HMPREF3213_03125 [Heyndrickxia coagulans]|uniref:Uncharacterized protein n=1 Tax=Heyndrickxia coagulans TaxID=1398 RepID=A0A133KEM0_HEYCO|nr:hypothetical protein HMPREF3213_03125 [Heyndrickxia coagulans]
MTNGKSFSFFGKPLKKFKRKHKNGETPAFIVSHRFFASYILCKIKHYFFSALSQHCRQPDCDGPSK